MRITVNALTIRPGGGLTVLAGIIDTFCKLKHQCRVIVSDSKTIDYLNKKYNRCIDEGHLSIKKIRVPFGVTGIYLYQVFFFKNSQSCIWADCIVGINFYFPSGKPTVIYHINLLHFARRQYNNISSLMPSNWVRDYHSHLALKFASINLFESKYLMQCASFFSDSINNPKILYFRSALIPDFTVPVEKSRRMLNRIIAITSSQKHKNNTILISMLQCLFNSRFRDWRLLIVCSGGKEFDNLRAFSSSLGLSEYIDYTGRISDQELAVLLSQSLCLVSTSLVESFCMVAIEAMSVGCPCVVANSTSMPESVGPWGQVVAPFSSNEYAEAVLKYRNDSPFYESMINGGIKFAKKYSADNFDKRLSEEIDYIKNGFINNDKNGGL